MTGKGIEYLRALRAIALHVQFLKDAPFRTHIKVQLESDGTFSARNLVDGATCHSADAVDCEAWILFQAGVYSRGTCDTFDCIYPRAARSEYCRECK